jgi:uncharacterized membrane protein YkgB
MNEDIVLFPVAFGAMTFVLWTIFSTIRRFKIAKLQADVQNRLIEKFGTTQDLLAYVQTDAGKQLLESLSVERTSPFSRIIGAVQAGIIMFLFGLALLFLRGRVSGAAEGFLVFGTVFVTLGVGFAISAAASYSLSKSFGLLNGTMSRR